jgi:hypothetical protein
MSGVKLHNQFTRERELSSRASSMTRRIHSRLMIGFERKSLVELEFSSSELALALACLSLMDCTFTVRQALDRVSPRIVTVDYRL